MDDVEGETGDEGNECVTVFATAGKEEERLSWDGCLCHCFPKETTGLANCSDVTWPRLVEAASLRQDTLWEFLVENEATGPSFPPRGHVHRRCYASYTHKKTVQRLKRKAEASSASDSDGDQLQVSPPRKRSSTRHNVSSKTNLHLCLFCQKKYRRRRGKAVEHLTQCETFEAGERIIHAAAVKRDERIQREMHGGPDCVAAEVMYHKHCYAKFVSGTAPTQTQATNRSDKYQEEVVVSTVKEDVIESKDVNALCMDALRNQFANRLQELGVESSYRNSMLKQRLNAEFGDSIRFVRTSMTEAERVVSATLSTDAYVGLMARAITTSKAQSDEPVSAFDDTPPPFGYEYDDADSMELYHAALSLHATIKSATNVLSAVPHACELTREAAARSVPDVPFNFLATVIGGPEHGDSIIGNQRAELPEKLSNTVVSIGQDLVYAGTHGRVIPPKQVALPMAIRHLTKSQLLITTLNKFGHGVSDSKLSEIETGLALDVADSSTYVPGNISGTGQVVFAWDNNDIAEETLSGEGTTHCTTGIVLQDTSPNAPTLQQSPPHLVEVSTRRLGKRPPRPLPASAPAELVYISGARPRPPPVHAESQSEPEAASESLGAGKGRDMLWVLLRCREDKCKLGRPLEDSQQVPGWAGFNAGVHNSERPQCTRVGYLPIIPESPTKFSTIYKLIHRSWKIAEKRGQDHCIITVDQAVYAKAAEVLWSHRAEFEKVVLRLGAFHTACAFMAVIGKRFSGSGLLELLTESGVVGPNAAKNIISGKPYNRALRIHKLVYEALMQLNVQAFESSIGEGLTEQQQEAYQYLDEALQAIRDSTIFDGVGNIQHSPQFQLFLDMLQDYNGKMETSGMGQFWLSYIEMVGTLLQFIRATRTGNWSLHLDCVRIMLPWFFAYDHFNYARYLSFYWHEMRNLPQTNNAAYQVLEGGHFSVARSTNSFARIPVDQCLEQTFNRDSKTRGGVVGFSRNPGAVQRWVLTTHERAAAVNACFSLAQAVSSDLARTSHKESMPSRKARDQQDLELIMSVFEAWGNPFQDSSGLVSLASRAVADETMKSDLMTAYSVGECALNTFLVDRLQRQAVDFFAPLSSRKLKTLAWMPKKSSKSSTVAIAADKSLFQKLVIMAQVRSFNMREVLMYELGAVPWSLANADGSLTKTQKSKLMEILEKDVMLAEVYPVNSAVLIDAMALLQTYTAVPRTFGELSIMVFSHLMSVLSKDSTCRVDFVADQYFALSIKTTERESRYGSASLPLTVDIQRPDQPTPKDWKRFMAGGANKTALVRFMADHWCSDRRAASLFKAGKQLFVTVDGTCSQMTLGATQQLLIATDVADLSSSQEEADTRLVLHANHALRSGCEAAVIRSPDTDVLVIALGHASYMPDGVFFHTGTKSRKRLIPVSGIANKLGQEVCSALMGFHAFTGCDSTSAFSGRGKVKAFQLMSDSTVMMEAMSALGQSYIMDDMTVANCEAFACAIYGHSSASEINTVRYAYFCQPSRSKEPKSMPPSKDALRQHTLRANYQAAVWRSALQPDLHCPSPEGHGWHCADGKLRVTWMDQGVAPTQILQLVSCSCQRGCKTKQCSCRKHNLLCTDVCSCSGCSNIHTISAEVRQPDNDTEDAEARPDVESGDSDGGDVTGTSDTISSPSSEDSA